MTGPARPLDGVRVVDTTVERGAFCGRLLADLGAAVVLVEPPGGSPARAVAPVRHGISLPFAVRALGKTSVTVDPADGAAMLALLDGADIWVDDAKPGVLERRGLAPTDVVARAPHLVVTTITDFGYHGPYAGYEGTDPVLVALSGLLFRAGVPELPPVMPPTAMAYDIAGLVGALVALLGYWQRLETGRGQHLDVSVMQACAQTNDWGLSAFSFMRTVGGVYAEIRNGAGPVYDMHPCRDGFVRLSIVTPADWRRVRAWLGEPADLQDPALDTSAGRAAIADRLRGLYRALFAPLAMVEAAEEGQRRGLGITPVLGPADILAAPHFAARRTFVPTRVTGGLDAGLPSGFFVIDGTRVGPRGPVPDVATTAAPPPVAPVPPPRPPAGARARPFEGLRVLDFGVAGAAPEIARIIADHGGDVIRVESRRRPDLFRTLMGGEMSPMFAASNRSKRSFGVDLTSPEGQHLIRRLVERADVVVENLPPGAMATFGLDPADLCALNPRAIVVSSQLMGSGGPWTAWKGYGSNAQTTGGLTHLWSFAGMAPVGANVAYPDHVVGRLGATAVVAALIRRRDTGAGCHIELAQVEAVVNFLAERFLEESLDPGRAGPRGNDSDRGVPWNVYPCAGEQRWCVITCRDDRDWDGLVSALGRPAWTEDDALGTAAGRQARHDDIDRRIAEWTSARTDDEVMTALQARGVPAGKMMYISGQPDDPHLRARGYAHPLRQPPLGEILVEGPAFWGTELAPPIIGPAPAIGEHTRAIGAELLGLDTAELDDLIARGVLYEPVTG